MCFSMLACIISVTKMIKCQERGSNKGMKRELWEALLCVNWAPTRLVLVIINYHWMRVYWQSNQWWLWIQQRATGIPKYQRVMTALMNGCQASRGKHKGSVVVLLTSHFLWTRAPVRDTSALLSSVLFLNSFDIDSEQLLLLFLKRSQIIRSLLLEQYCEGG